MAAASIVLSGVASPSGKHYSAVSSCPHSRRVIPPEDTAIQRMVTIPNPAISGVNPPITRNAGIFMLASGKLRIERSYLISRKEHGLAFRCIVLSLNVLCYVFDWKLIPKAIRNNAAHRSKLLLWNALYHRDRVVNPWLHNTGIEVFAVVVVDQVKADRLLYAFLPLSVGSALRPLGNLLDTSTKPKLAKLFFYAPSYVLKYPPKFLRQVEETILP